MAFKAENHLYIGDLIPAHRNRVQGRPSGPEVAQRDQGRSESRGLTSSMKHENGRRPGGRPRGKVIDATGKRRCDTARTEELNRTSSHRPLCSQPDRVVLKPEVHPDTPSQGQKSLRRVGETMITLGKKPRSPTPLALQPLARPCIV